MGWSYICASNVIYNITDVTSVLRISTCPFVTRTTNAYNEWKAPEHTNIKIRIHGLV